MFKLLPNYSDSWNVQIFLQIDQTVKMFKLLPNCLDSWNDIIL